MIKYIYGTKNKKSGNFNAPLYYDFPKENAAEAFTISARETPDEAVEVVRELEVYYLGSLDTKTGVIISEVEYLLDLGPVIDGKD